MMIIIVINIIAPGYFHKLSGSSKAYSCLLLLAATFILAVGSKLVFTTSWWHSAGSLSGHIRVLAFRACALAPEVLEPQILAVLGPWVKPFVSETEIRV